MWIPDKRQHSQRQTDTTSTSFWIKLPFGLKNAPAQFSRMMQIILGDFRFVEIYLDDIIIYSSSYESHLEHIKLVFERLKRANLKINPAKCVWFAKEIKILEHIVLENGVKMDMDKVHAIDQMTFPKNVKQIQ